jgi:two-component system response regulator TctD
MEDRMGVKFLIVDDEENLVFFLRRTLLMEFPESQVDTAYSGEEGLSRMAEQSYDLIIADLRMPGVDGRDLIKGIRYLDATVPIILMTGYGSEALKEEAAKLGIDYYMDKPFDMGEMSAIITRLLEGRER